MSTIPSMTVTPSSAASAYARVQGGDLDTPAETNGAGCGDVLSRAIQSVADAGHKADDESVKAIAGKGNLTEVATAVTRAELSMQTALAIRDRVVQSYQDITRMQI